MILDEVAGKDCGATHWEFNIFALTLDFDKGLAVVEDLLQEDASESVGLSAFLVAAAAFGDPTSAGDGLTEASRHPPSYVVDTSGDVEGLDG